MKRSELERALKTLQREYAVLLQMQEAIDTFIQDAITNLQKALGPCIREGEEVNEAGSEQVQRCDQAIRFALARLTRARENETWTRYQVMQSLYEGMDGGNQYASMRETIIIQRPVEAESIEVTDPFTEGLVSLSVFKTKGGGMFAIDTSFLLHFPDALVPSPFDSNVIFDLAVKKDG